MYKILSKITSDRKVIGYKLETEEHKEIKLELSIILELADKELIEGVKVNKKTNSLASNGLDMRKLKAINIEKSPEDGKFDSLEDSKEEVIVSKTIMEDVDAVSSIVDLPNNIVKAYLYIENEAKMYGLDYLSKDNYPICDNWVDLAKKSKDYCIFLQDLYGIHRNMNSVAKFMEKKLDKLGFKWTEQVESTYLTNLAFEFKHQEIDSLFVTLSTDIVNYNGKLTVRVKASVVNLKNTDKVNKTRKLLSRIYRDMVIELNDISIIGGVI